jgi:putative FmdB family regulatory protein
MPTYEYRCPEGHEFERFYRKISDAAGEVACPECGKIAERRMSAGAGLLFKGSGFYLTDYGKNAHRTSGDAPASDSKSEKSSGESKSESKSESKAESKPAESKSDAKPATPAPNKTKAAE